jgi:hypothetical protein
VTHFLHWRKTTWALLVWSGYIATWAAITGPAPAAVVVWWLVGLVVFGSLVAVTRPRSRQGRGLGGFVRPGWTHWPAVDLHRTKPERGPA